MITAPKRIDIIEPAIPHPPIEDGVSTYDVAQRLEQKYELIHKFVALHKKDIERLIAFEMAYAIKHNSTNLQMDSRLDTSLRQMWRVFLINEEHGIRTLAAEKEGRQSFVKTGTYMGNFTVGVAR